MRPQPIEQIIDNLPNDPVNHPAHYTGHPSGIECIEITRWMNFNLGNVIKAAGGAALPNSYEEAKRRLSMTLCGKPGLVVPAFLNIEREGQRNGKR